MSINSFIPKVAEKGNFGQACRQIGLDPNKTSLVQYAIKKYGISVKHPERLGIADIFELKNQGKNQGPAKIARKSGDKPLTYMVNDIIG